MRQHDRQTLITAAHNSPSDKYGGFVAVLEKHYFSVRRMPGCCGYVIAQHKQNVSAQFSSINFRKQEATAVQSAGAAHSALQLPNGCDALRAVTVGYERKRTTPLQVLRKHTGQLALPVIQLDCISRTPAIHMHRVDVL
jgi:hypothetical protein